MNYHRPELAARLAADYVLGLMPVRARRRFERVAARDATLAAHIGGWSDRLSPLDDTADAVDPPARVWRAIERRIVARPPQPGQARSRAYVFWRYFGVAAAASCAVLVLYVAVSPLPMTRIVAQFADRVAALRHTPSEVAAASIGNLPTSERERPRWIRGVTLLTPGAAPQVILEPPASSR
jgi:anti-sigma-K factor RskA